MCGRFRQGADSEVGPGDVATVQGPQGELRLRMGYRAPWQQAGARPLINARLETVGIKPAWREAARERRCAVPATAWWEGRGRERYRIEGEAGETLWLAGLWWPQGLVVVTREAAPAIAAIHHRQPALVPEPSAWTGEGPLGPAIEALGCYPVSGRLAAVRC